MKLQETECRILQVITVFIRVKFALINFMTLPGLNSSIEMKAGLLLYVQTENRILKTMFYILESPLLLFFTFDVCVAGEIGDNCNTGQM